MGCFMCSANRGVGLFLGGLALSNRLGLLRSLAPAHDSGGFKGAVNLILGEPGASDWHFYSEAARLTLRAGRHPSPVSTLSISTPDFIALLSGRLSFSLAQMTGRIRSQGEGHASFLLHGLLTQFQKLREGSGPGRVYARAVLRLAGAPPEKAPVVAVDEP